MTTQNIPRQAFNQRKLDAFFTLVHTLAPWAVGNPPFLTSLQSRGFEDHLIEW